MDETATVKFRSVKADRIGKDEAILTSGLKPDETVIALGAHLLHEGQSIRIHTKLDLSHANLQSLCTGGAGTRHQSASALRTT